MSDEGLQSFLNATGRHPLLTAEQEVLLARQVHEGADLEQRQAQGEALTPAQQRKVRAGQRAKTQMVNCNLRMVVAISKKYVRRARHMSMLDLIQEGTIGLMRAVELFDPARGYKFSTYAYWWIRQAMARAMVLQDNEIRMPNTVAELLPRLKRTAERLTHEYGRAPNAAELAEALDVKEAELKLVLERGMRPSSLDAALVDDGSALAELLPDPKTLPVDDEFYIDEYWRLEAALSKLDARERLVLEGRHALNGTEQRTLSSLAAQLGVSRQLVQQLEQRALRKLRLYMRTTPALPQPHLVEEFAGHVDISRGQLRRLLSA